MCGGKKRAWHSGFSRPEPWRRSLFESMARIAAHLLLPALASTMNIIGEKAVVSGTKVLRCAPYEVERVRFHRSDADAGHTGKRWDLDTPSGWVEPARFERIYFRNSFVRRDAGRRLLPRPAGCKPFHPDQLA